MRLGDIKMKCRCNMCWSHFKDDDELELLKDEKEYFHGCPKCKTDGYLMDLEDK
ncbi:hypothetical protein [Peribacillus frigoritolerans]|uniref:Uncharacterized protein n=1 Tax=Peribacillus castrilensis TaxID=2897690 RepID=A0AAW9NLX8_9BACI|nr:hypothetical protein [Peribacillus castrilensis]